ncbi:Protein Mon2 [Manis pentadactyla]|nr:Protein Mon2 [Manis pentadactyla]
MRSRAQAHARVPIDTYTCPGTSKNHFRGILSKMSPRGLPEPNFDSDVNVHVGALNYPGASESTANSSDSDA